MTKNILLLFPLFIPASFLFHFYEYGQHLKREDPSYLLLGTILFVIITGILSTQLKKRTVLIANIITGFISIILAQYFIVDDGSWFKPFSRDIVIILTSIALFIGQFTIRQTIRMLTRQ